LVLYIAYTELKNIQYGYTGTVPVWLVL